MLLWMAKQSTLNSRSVIVSVDCGGHFWQRFNLSSTKGHFGQMSVGKFPSPRFQTTSCPICVSLCRAARWGKWERKKKHLNFYCIPLLHSAATVDLLAAKLYQRRILWANCRNPHMLICRIQAVSDPCKQKYGYGACAVRSRTKDLWVVPTQCGGLCSAFDFTSDNHSWICFAPPHTGASCHAFSPV